MRLRTSERGPERTVSRLPRTAPFLPSSTTAVEPVRAIGVGGTARLWLAQHPLHGDVALKIVREELCGTLDAAGLEARVVEHLKGGELTVTLWRGLKAAERRRKAA